jgi:hypothetical protein
MSNEYELTFTVRGVAGIQRERLESSSEQTSRDLLRAKYQVQIISGRQTRFGERDDRRDGKR